MTLSEEEKRFFADFFERQRNIGKKSLENTSTLARAFINGITWGGISSPKTIDSVKDIIKNIEEQKEDI